MADRAGIVYLVGAGPGDPGLLTLAGRDALRRAEVVVYDFLASPRLLDLAPPGALRIAAGKTSGHALLRQPEINAVLAEHAALGRVVVRLKGGDPSIFGRGAEEAEYLRDRGIAFRIVPGVTAAIGAAAYAGLPLTHREVSSAVAFVTGHGDPEHPTTNPTSAGRLDWDALARFPGTLVVYMGAARIAGLCRVLVAAGKPATTPAALVEAATLPRQRTVAGTLADLADRAEATGIAAPALMIVGEVALRRPGLDWFESLPLAGRRILMTRPAEESDRSAAAIEALGAEVIAAPMVRILPVEDTGPLDAAIARLGSFDWLVFTSSNGVRHFFDRVDRLGLDLRVAGHLRLAAIGPTTAQALRDLRLRADVVPATYRSEALADALRPLVAGQRVLLARADRGREVLRDVLGPVAEVEQVATYRNADAPTLDDAAADRLRAGTVDWVTLTSPAIAERFRALIPAEAEPHVGRSIRLASLSPVTSEAVRRLGWPVAAEAEDATWDGVVRAIVAAESARGA